MLWLKETNNKNVQKGECISKDEIMSRTKLSDQKLCVKRNSIFHDELSDLFNKGETPSFEDIWDKSDKIPLTDKDKINYDIIQFSFVILNGDGNPLFFERGSAHKITTGNSILLSCSPYKPKCPQSMDDIRLYFREQLDDVASDYTIELLGIARNTSKGPHYYFYVFSVKFSDGDPRVLLKESDTPLGYFDPTLPVSSVVLDRLRGNNVDMLTLKALFPLFDINLNDVKGCAFHKDTANKLLDYIFHSKEIKIIPKDLGKTQEKQVRFCLVQLDFSVERTKPPDKFAYLLNEKEEVRQKIFKALTIASKKKSNIVVFPELSFDKEWVDKIRGKYKEMIIIGGSYYEDSFNTCPIIIGGDVFPIQKVIPSPTFEKKIGTRGMKSGKENFVFQTKYGQFAVLICYDYIKKASLILEHKNEEIRNIDFLIVPQYNKAVRRFQIKANADCLLDSHPYIIQVNAVNTEEKKMGKTCIIGIEHDDILSRYRDDGYSPSDQITYKLVEMNEEEIVIVDLDISRESVSGSLGNKMEPIARYQFRNGKWSSEKNSGVNQQR